MRDFSILASISTAHNLSYLNKRQEHNLRRVDAVFFHHQASEYKTATYHPESSVHSALWGTYDDPRQIAPNSAEDLEYAMLAELHDEKQDMVKQMKQDLRDGKITASTQSVTIRPGETVSWAQSPTVTETVAYVSEQHGFGAQVGLDLSTGTDMDFTA
jgi:plastocyanin